MLSARFRCSKVFNLHSNPSRFRTRSIRARRERRAEHNTQSKFRPAYCAHLVHIKIPSKHQEHRISAELSPPEISKFIQIILKLRTQRPTEHPNEPQKREFPSFSACSIRATAAHSLRISRSAFTATLRSLLSAATHRNLHLAASPRMRCDA